MIDPVWLQRFVELGDADTGGYSAEQLAVLLDDPAEVLPYLLTRARAFAEWPKARAALAKATAGALRAQPRDRVRGAPPSPHRAELHDALHTALTEHAVNAQPGETRRIAEHMVRLIDRVRLDETRGIDSPSMFITARPA